VKIGDLEKNVMFVTLIVAATFLIIKFLPINIAKFKYPDITLTLYDQNWHGSPYTISEVTTHRWYEKGQIGKNAKSLNCKIQESNFDFTLYIYQYQDDYNYKKGNDKQLCITQDYLTISQVSSSFLSKDYVISSNSSIDYVDSASTAIINDYAISFIAELKVTGVFSEKFVKEQVQELYVQSSLHHIDDYFGSRHN